MGQLGVWKIAVSESFWVVASDADDAIRVLVESNMAEDAGAA